MQPFNNLVVTQTFTAAQLRAVLEQQFVGGGTPAQTVQRILQISNGFTFTYNPAAPPNSKITAMALNGTPINPAATYRVTTNDFLANGGDGFAALKAGTDRVTAPGFDVDALWPTSGVRPHRSGQDRPTGSSGCDVSQTSVFGLALEPGRGILDHVIHAARFFYYGTGSPAAVGRA